MSRISPATARDIVACFWRLAWSVIQTLTGPSSMNSMSENMSHYIFQYPAGQKVLLMAVWQRVEATM